MDIQIVIVGVVVVGCVAALVRGAIRQVKNTAGACGGGCSGCKTSKSKACGL
jgi:uncharacterized membrane protein required for colicin V production